MRGSNSSSSSNRHRQAVKAISKALKNKISVNTVLPNLISNHESDSLLHAAIYYKEFHLFKELMAHHPDIGLRDENGRTPLIYAALFNHHSMVKDLLDAGADPNEKDHSLNTALHWVAQNGGKESAELLLASGADMYALDRDGKTPIEQHFYGMGYGGDENITSVLIQHDVDLNRCQLTEYDLLKDRINSYDMEAVKELLNRKPDLDEEQCNECLSCAIRNPAMIKLFASYVYKRFGRSDNIHYPLYKTVYNTKNTDVAALLIQYGANAEEAASKLEEYIGKPVRLKTSGSPESLAQQLVSPLVKFRKQKQNKENFNSFTRMLPNIILIVIQVLFILIPTIYLCFSSSWLFVFIPATCIGFMYLLIPKHPATGDIQGMGIVWIGIVLDIILMFVMTVIAILKFKFS